MGSKKYNMMGLDIKENQTQWMNDATYFDYYMRLKELAINQFEWVNLPPTCDNRFLELILFEMGHALFFKHKINESFLTLQSNIAGPLNMYRIPIRRRAYAITGFNQECSDVDSVIIYNNYLRQPTALTIQLYAQRLTQIERAINANINAQKWPVLMYGSKAQQRTLQEVYRQWAGNEPVIFGDKNLNEQPLQAIKTDVPEAYINLMVAKQQIWNEAMTFLGIDNANIQKKERMINNEVESNNQLLRAQRYQFLNARKDACNMINELFAADLEAPIDVRFRRYDNEEGGEYDWQDTPQNSDMSLSPKLD